MTDNTEPANNTESMQNSGDIMLDVYKTCIEEGSNSIERQFTLFEDNRASVEKLTTLNTGILGLILTALGVAGLTEEAPLLDITAFLNRYTVAGFAFLLLSIGVAALAYRPIKQVIGLGGDALIFIATENTQDNSQVNSTDITDNEQSSMSDQLEFYNWLTKQYGQKINYNREVNIKKALITATAILFFIFEITFFTLGVIQAFDDITIPGWILVITFLFLLFVTWMSSVPRLLFELL